jgi:cell division protein ZapA
MSNVTVTLGGRHYTVACAAGEEEHIEALGRTIDGKLEGMASVSGQSEARTLLFAALLLADELYEARSGDVRAGPTDDGQTADALERLAERLEDLAERLESAT